MSLAGNVLLIQLKNSMFTCNIMEIACYHSTTNQDAYLLDSEFMGGLNFRINDIM